MADITIHVKVPQAVYAMLQHISKRETRTVSNVIRCALAEIGIRGFTDTLNGKEEAAKRKRL